jgi:hypothetical protein
MITVEARALKVDCIYSFKGSSENKLWICREVLESELYNSICAEIQYVESGKIFIVELSKHKELNFVCNFADKKRKNRNNVNKSKVKVVAYKNGRLVKRGESVMIGNEIQDSETRWFS